MAQKRKAITKKAEAAFALPTIPSKNNSSGNVLLFEPSYTESGASINEETALRISTVYDCLQVKHDAVAMVPRHVYRRNEVGREIAREHPTYKLLHDAPNDYMTASELYGLLTFHKNLYGNGYAFIDRIDGVPVSIQPLLPDRTEPFLRNSQLLYRSKVGGDTIEFMPGDIIHVKGMGCDGLSGYPTVRMMRNELGTERSASEFSGKFFGSGANFGGVIHVKGKLSDDARQRFKTALQTEYVGNSNAFKLLLLEDGWTFEKFNSVAPQDGQLNESRKLLIRKIAARFKVPPHKVGDDSRTSFSSLEQENKSFYTECINPELRSIEDQMNLKVFAEAERETYYFEFNRMGFLQADLSVQTNHFHLMLQDRVYLPNEVREYYGMNALPGGDKPLSTPNNNAPTNTQTPTDTTTQTKTENPTKDTTAEVSNGESTNE